MMYTYQFRKKEINNKKILARISAYYLKSFDYRDSCSLVFVDA